MRLLIAVLLSLTSMIGVAAQNGEQTVDPEARRQMDLLAEKAINEAVQVVAESGGFYPFALVADRDDVVRLVGAAQRPQEGVSKNDMAISLFWQVRKFLQENIGFVTAAVVKEHVGQLADGQSVPGIWVTVDHRNAPPWVVFLPFIPSESGSYRLADEPLYLPANEGLFLPGAVTEATQ